MNKLLVDTNVYLDWLLHRIPHFVDSELFLKKAEQTAIEIFISPISIGTITYFLQKSLPSRQVKNSLQQLFGFSEVAMMDKNIFLHALSSSFQDIEDAYLHYSAVPERCDAIITRNVKDFKAGSLPVYTPTQILSFI